MKDFLKNEKSFSIIQERKPKMIKREHYIQQIRPFYESNLIKIITRIRRCGKSVIMEQIIQEIKEKTDNIIYLNFEDKKVSANIKMQMS